MEIEMPTSSATNASEGLFTVSASVRIAVWTVFPVLTMIGIVGNIFVIAAVVLFKQLQTRMNVFLVNLAVADLLACLTFPAQGAVIILVDGGPVWLCVLTNVINGSSMGCSVVTLMLIAVSRWMVISKPYRTFQTIFAPAKILAMVLAAWVTGLLGMLPALDNVCQVVNLERDAPFLQWVIPAFPHRVPRHCLNRLPPHFPPCPTTCRKLSTITDELLSSGCRHHTQHGCHCLYLLCVHTAIHGLCRCRHNLDTVGYQHIFILHCLCNHPKLEQCGQSHHLRCTTSALYACL